MRASSMDLRERARLDSDAGMTAAEVAAKYRVSGSWVRLLKQRRRETGEVAPRVQRHGRRGMLEPHLHPVADLIAAHPDRTLAELKDALATPARVPTVWRAVRALGLTVKKTVRPSEHDRPDVAAARVAWHTAAPTWDVAHLVLLDETGITNTLLRRYGRAPRGARVHDHAPGGRWQTSTLLAALRVTGLTAPGVFDGAIDGESFRAYIEQILVPTLQPGDIVIADTLGAHKVAGIQRAIQAAGATLWYLPPYSPDLNPHRALLREAHGPRSHRTLSQQRDALAVPRYLSRALQPSTNAATIFGTAGTRPPHGHEKRSSLNVTMAAPKLRLYRFHVEALVTGSENLFDSGLTFAPKHVYIGRGVGMDTWVWNQLFADPRSSPKQITDCDMPPRRACVSHRRGGDSVTASRLSAENAL